MEATFKCPCCYSSNWSKGKEHFYHRLTIESISNRYFKRRHEILFNVWFPDQQKVVLTSLYCLTCGFMCYSPRPTHEDLEAKYQYLSERGNIGTLMDPSPRAIRLDHYREVFMKKVIAKYHDVHTQKVLDVGGGDGRLLRPFLDSGCQCKVVDFNLNPHPGVERIGSTLDDIPSGSRFDILICSHVLEHVSEPGKFLQKLSSVLSDKGVVYIEVPLEIWKGIPIHNDPVTHINFFTVNSLKNALILNGLKPLAIKSKLSPYNGRYKRVAWTVASAINVTTPLRIQIGSSATKKLIDPDPITKITRHIENLWISKVLNSSL